MSDQLTGDDRITLKTVPPRTWVIWLAIFGGILFLMFFKDQFATGGERITQHQFWELVDSGQIVHATVAYDPQNQALNEIVGTYYKDQNGTRVEAPFRAKVRLTWRLEEKLFGLPQFEPRQPNTMLLSVVWSVLPIIVIAIMIWFFFIRQIKKVSRNSPTTPDLQAKASEQQVRFDKILDKWEQQAVHMDAVLEKMDRAADLKK